MKKSAEQLFLELGFKKNKSECYNDKHILYEQEIKTSNVNDIFSIEFKHDYFIYTNLTKSALKTRKKLLKAISKQMKEIEKMKR